jgi:peptidyl-prolyl cis-trans isomerase C
MSFIRTVFKCVLALGISATAVAFDYPSQEGAEKTFTKRGDQTLSFGDVDVMVLKIPKSDKAVFVNDYDKFASALDGELMNKQLAAEGRRLGLDSDPLVLRAMKRAAEIELARIAIEVLVSQKLEAAGFEELAREVYLANPNAYVLPSKTKIAQIMVDKNSVNASEFEKLTQTLETRSKSGESFEKLIEEFSTDPFKSKTGGVFELVSDSDAVPEVIEAARKLERIGEISPVVKTTTGIYVLKLLERTDSQALPFERVRDQIIEQLKAQQKEKTQQEIVSDLRAANPEYDELAFEELKTRYGRIPVKGVSAPGAEVLLPPMETIRPKPIGKPE